MALLGCLPRLPAFRGCDKYPALQKYLVATAELVARRFLPIGVPCCGGLARVSKALPQDHKAGSSNPSDLVLVWGKPISAAYNVFMVCCAGNLGLGTGCLALIQLLVQLPLLLLRSTCVWLATRLGCQH